MQKLLKIFIALVIVFLTGGIVYLLLGNTKVLPKRDITISSQTDLPTPVRVSLAADKEIKPNQVFHLDIQIMPYFDYAGEANLTLELPEGFQILEGDSMWRGSFFENKQIDIPFTIQASGVKQGEIKARVIAPNFGEFWDVLRFGSKNITSTSSSVENRLFLSERAVSQSQKPIRRFTGFLEKNKTNIENQGSHILTWRVLDAGPIFSIVKASNLRVLSNLEKNENSEVVIFGKEYVLKSKLEYEVIIVAEEINPFVHITITAPANGEIIQKGKIYTVKWEPKEKEGAFYLELIVNIKDTGDKSLVSREIDLKKGFYDLFIPEDAPESRFYTVRIFSGAPYNFYSPVGGVEIGSSALFSVMFFRE